MLVGNGEKVLVSVASVAVNKRIRSPFLPALRAGRCRRHTATEGSKATRLSNRDVLPHASCGACLFRICSPLRFSPRFLRSLAMADQIVITEKTSQAKDVRAAVGSRYGDIF